MLNKNGKLKLDPFQIGEKIRQNNEKKRLKEIDEQNREQFELALKLSDWELENGVRVESILRKPVKADSVSFVAVRYLHVMSPEEKAEYIRIINEDRHEYEQLTKEESIPSGEIQGQTSAGEGDTENSGGESDPK